MYFYVGGNQFCRVHFTYLFVYNFVRSTEPRKGRIFDPNEGMFLSRKGKKNSITFNIRQCSPTHKRLVNWARKWNWFLSPKRKLKQVWNRIQGFSQYGNVYTAYCIIRSMNDVKVEFVHNLWSALHICVTLGTIC